MGVIDKLYRLGLLSVVALGGCASSGSPSADDGWVSDSLFISSYDFVDVAADTIIDDSNSMKPFYDAIKSIGRAAQGNINVVPIVHYGDSHIQGGFLPNTIMRAMAHTFGNAGRGMIVPHKLSGKNEPSDFSITSSSSHNSATVINPSAMSIGVSGVSILADAPSRYHLQMMYNPTDTMDYRFSRVVVFHDSLAPMIGAVDERMVDDGANSDIFKPFMTEINLMQPTDSISLKTYRDGAFARGPIYGFSLENGSSGVLYHSMGVNGACFLHWGRQKSVGVQCAALNPALIIVSLGSNEAAGNNFISSVFMREMDSFISNLRAENPTSAILLTTPPQAMRVGRGRMTPNKNFEAVRSAIVEYGAANKLAVIDLYGITSGEGSAQKWRDNDMLARDGIHYTAQGYKLQGILIYNAIRRGVRR